MTVPTIHSCPLCEAGSPELIHRDKFREYLRCPCCLLVFVPSEYFCSCATEKAQYDLHQNDPGDLRYRRFLSRLAEPMIRRIPPGAKGLDFGCGPGPTLSVMMAEAGFPTAIYDPYYHHDASLLERSYDFITASEVVEHLHRPRFELERLWSCLNSGGTLGIMTKRCAGVSSFAAWHYKNDPTHVIFFSDTTFHWLGRHWKAKVEIVGPDVVLLTKNEAFRAISSYRLEADAQKG